MRIVAVNGDQTYLLDSVQYELESISYLCSSSSDSEVTLRVTIPEVNHELAERDYDQTVVVMLRRKDLSELQVHRVYVTQGANRVIAGWLIPISSLFSSNHQFSEDVHFADCVSRAMKCLMERDDGFVVYKTLPAPAEMTLTEVLPSYVSMLVLNTEVVQADKVDLYLLSLLRFGYAVCKSELREPMLGVDVNESYRKNVTIYETTLSQLLNTDALSMVDSAIDSSHPVMGFFFLYQVCEILIENNLLKKMDSLITRLQGATMSLQESRNILFEVRDSFGAKKVLNELFQSLDSNVENEIHLAIKNVIGAFNGDSGNSVAANFYQIRNTMFHSYRTMLSVPVDLVAKLNKGTLVALSLMSTRM